MSAAACAPNTKYERGAFERIGHGPAVAGTPDANAPGEMVLDGTLDRYVAYAMAHHPGLEAAFEEWRAAVYAIADKRRLPEPTLSYGVFLRRVETRVGPQRQRFGLSQMIPWPTKRRAAASAAASVAEAAERRFQAQAVRVRAQVADAFWGVWQMQRARDIEREIRGLLVDLSDITRARMELGKASLADLSQIDLALARRDDVLASLDARERTAKAALRQAIGAPVGTELPIAPLAPLPLLPDESDDSLRASARVHPRLEQLTSMARASDDQARAAGARRMPDFMVGLDYIETGPAMLPNVPDSGKDPVVLMVSVSLPVWRGQYRDAETSARAQAAAYRARRHEAETSSDAELDAAVVRVRESARRIALMRDTLIPRAELSYAAVVGSYHTGATALANALMAHQSVLDLRVQLVTEQADYGRAWARMEDAVGRPVSARRAPEEVRDE